MHHDAGDVRLHHVERGHGLPLVLLHGAGTDHRELMGALEPLLSGLPGTRRVYVDLPGHGRTPAPERLRSNDDVVDALLDLVDDVTGGAPFLVGGHSLGAYLARGVAARRRDRTLGLLLLCPAARTTGEVPPRTVVRTEGDPAAELDPDDVAGFEEYVVVRTPTTARRYREHVLPGAAVADEAALARLMPGWALRDEPGADGGHTYPTLVVAGRQDSWVGWADAAALLGVYPRATLAVLDGAGHALVHERPELLEPLLDDWLDRCAHDAEHPPAT